MRNMLTGVNPARAGEDSHREERSNNDTTERCRISAETETVAEFFSRVIWNDNDRMYMYRQAQMRILRFFYNCRSNPVRSGEWFDSIPHF